MENFKSRLNRFIFLFVFFPVILLMLLLAVVVLKQVVEQGNKDILTLKDEGATAMEDELDRLLMMVSDVTADPDIRKVLSLRRSPDLRGESWSVERWYQEILKMGDNANTNDLNTITLINNPIARRLRGITNKEGALAQVVISDVLGEVVAAANKPELSNLKGKESWKDAIRSPSQRSFIEGISTPGTFNIYRAIWEHGEESHPLGAIQVTVNIERMVQEMEYTPQEDEGVIYLAMDQWYGRGEDELLDRSANDVVSYLKTNYKDEGYTAGVKYLRGIAAKKYHFSDNQLMVVGMRVEKTIPDEMVKTVAATVLGGGLFMVVLMGLALKTGRDLGEETGKTLEAGNLLIGRIREQAPKAGKSEDREEIRTEFDKWLSGYRQSVLDNIETHEFEMQRDLELARDFQMAYLNRPYPKVPDVHTPGRMRLRFHHRYRPAMALGGDFYDVVKLSHDCAGIFVADVMGHGTRSALITAILRTLMGDLRPHGRNSRHFLSEMNKHFYDLLEQITLPHPLFASAYYFVADVTARAATFSTAGHPAPYHLKRATNTLDRLEVASPHGAAIGISREEEYTGGACRLNIGDTFVFYTDGLYEAFNSMGQEFGLTNLERAIRAHMHHSTDNLLDGIIAAVDEFTEGEPLHDDVCLVAIDVTDEPEEKEAD